MRLLLWPLGPVRPGSRSDDPVFAFRGRRRSQAAAELIDATLDFTFSTPWSVTIALVSPNLRARSKNRRAQLRGQIS